MIQVWLLDPDISKRRWGSRIERILRSHVDVIYVQDPWFFKEFGCEVTAHISSIVPRGTTNGLNTKLTYQSLIDANPKTKLGFVLDPGWERAVDYFKSLPNANIIRVV